MSELSIEEQLLVNCTRWAIAGAEPSLFLEIKTLILQNSIDWQKLWNICDKNRVIPLVYRSLQNISPDLVPPDILQELTDYIKFRTRESLRLSRELINILELLKTAGIIAVPFKGAGLSLLAYGSLTDRDFSDLDILVHRAEVAKTLEILRKNGYGDRYEFTPAQQAQRWEQHHEWDLINPKRAVALDLHWGFTERPIYFPLDLAALEPRLEKLKVAGTEILTFSPTDTLLILCVNGSKEFWHRLLRICDIAALISRYPDLNWEQLLETATRTGSRRMLFLGLILAREVMGTVLPESILNLIKGDVTANLLAQKVRERLFSDSHSPLERVEEVRYYLQMRERWSDRLRYAYYYFKYSGGLSPTDRDREWLDLPPGLDFIYYFARPFRVLNKYGTKIVKERSLN